MIPRSLSIEVSDVTGQKMFRARNVQCDQSIGELVDSLLGRMSMPANDSEGRPLMYHARLDREARHLNRSELAGEALVNDDRVSLMPDIDAG